jgi:hypothetical protein
MIDQRIERESAVPVQAPQSGLLSEIECAISDGGFINGRRSPLGVF